jgi:hypothetical protein
MKHLYIIADTDSCDTLSTDVCLICPLAKLRKKPDGSYMSCADAVGFKMPMDGTYKSAAIDQLIEIELLGDSDDKNK